MKLELRNAKRQLWEGHHDGVNYEVKPYGRGWHIVAKRRIVEPNGYAHSLGQPELLRIYVPNLKAAHRALEARISN